VDERINTNYREDIHLFSVLTNNTYYVENTWLLKELFEKSLQAKHGQYSVFDIQFEILREVIAAHSARQKYDRWKGRFAKYIKEARKNEAPPARIKRAQKRLQYMQDCATAAKFFLGQLRTIGDGIAWRFLGYDRPVLRLLAEHHYISAPTLGPGLYAEIQECARLAAQDQPFLLNSITNFLRFGDITVYDRLTDTFKLLEVKAGKSQTLRSKRQAKQLTLVQEGLQKGSHSVFPDTAITMIKCEKPLLTYAKVLEKAMTEAQQEKECASARVFGDYLSFGVFHTRRIINLSEEDVRQIQEDIIDRCYRICKSKSDVLLPIWCTNIMPALHFARPLAPYTIFPIAPALRFALMTGEFLLSVQLNISGLGRWLGKRGWVTRPISLPAKIPTGEATQYLPVLEIRRNNSPIGAELPLDIIAMAAMELWMPDSIERTAEAIIDHRPLSSNTAYTVSFPNVGRCAFD
jgi:hypothetical protein